MPKKLSVVIPAYNEEHRIGKTLEDIDRFFKTQNLDYEILVVNDGSHDNTKHVVLDLMPRIKNLHLIDNVQNHGKGWVTKEGMLRATGDVKLFMDADNSTTIEQVLPMLPFLEKGFDVVIGSIELPGAKINEHAQWYRRFVGHWSKYLIRLVAGLWDIHDTQRGFKLFTERAAKKIFSNQTIDRFGFDIEILAIAKKFKFKIKELPVIWNNSDESTVSLKSYVSVFMELLKVRINLWTGKYK